MMDKAPQRDGRMAKMVHRIDDWLVPMVFGLATVLVLVQVVTAVPQVRAAVDTMSGRFVSIPVDNVPTTVQQETATVQLYLSPAETRPDIAVKVNGRVVATFVRPSVTVSLHDGDQISVVRARPDGTVYVSVDHDDPHVILPAPGQSVKLSDGQPEVQFPAAKFAP